MAAARSKTVCSSFVLCKSKIQKEGKWPTPSRSMSSKLEEPFALHPLTSDEKATLESMVAREPTARVVVMPTHHFSDFGDFTGFRYDCDVEASGACLPISRRMFYGHTLVECLDGESDILKLMSCPDENRARMRQFLSSVDAECCPAMLDCIPDNTDALTGHEIGRAHV